MSQRLAVIAAWTGFCLGNILWQVFTRKYDWSVAADRSFYQAIMATWIYFRILK